MRLLYWYTRFLDEDGNPKKYHGIKYFELNLNTDKKYSFNCIERKLSEKPIKTPLPHGFWGNKPLYNINAIVGSNGAGKTTILHTMMDALQELYDRNIVSNNETIILVEDEKNNSCKQFVIHLLGSAKEKIQSPYLVVTFNSETFGKTNISNIQKSILQLIDCTKIIYLTNALSKLDDDRYHSACEKYPGKKYKNIEHYAREEFIYNCSLCATIRQDMESDCVTNRDLISGFFINEYYKQVKCVFDSTQYNNLIEIRKKGIHVPVPNRLSITMRKAPSKYKISENLNNAAHVSDQIAYRLCVLCFSSFLSNAYIDESEVAQITEKDIPRDATYDSFKYLFGKVSNASTGHSNLDVDYERYKNNCLEFIDYVCENMHELKRFIVPLKAEDDLKKGNQVKLFFPIDKEDEKNNWFIGFMERYRRTCTRRYYLDFSWGLSSGEDNLLRFFSTMFSTFRYSNSNIYNEKTKGQKISCDSVFLFMDEADLTYHPEWQRQLIQILTAFLPLEFGSCGVTDLQVVLATHSPLLLSDIPSNNVTYINKSDCESESNEYINTFGQNIHSILKNSFFLSNGSIGAFAVEKINDTAKMLREPDKLTEQKMDECKAIIDLVSPGILKGKLMALYIDAESKKFPSNSKWNMVKKIEENIKNFSTDELKEIIEKSSSELESRK